MKIFKTSERENTHQFWHSCFTKFFNLPGTLARSWCLSWSAPSGSPRWSFPWPAASIQRRGRRSEQGSPWLPETKTLIMLPSLINHRQRGDKRKKLHNSITFSSSRLNPIYLISDGVIQGHKWEIFPAEDLGHLEMCSWSFSHCFGFDFTAWVLLLSENCAQWSRVTAGESGEGGTGKGPATWSEDGRERSDTKGSPRHSVQAKHVARSRACTECTGALHWAAEVVWSNA